MLTAAFLVLFIAVVVFSTVCVVRFLEVLRESKEESDAIERWLRERAAYRVTVTAERRGTVTVGDCSSLLDDSPESASDQSGPRAA